MLHVYSIVLISRNKSNAVIQLLEPFAISATVSCFTVYHFEFSSSIIEIAYHSLHDCFALVLNNIFM